MKKVVLFLTILGVPLLVSAQEKQKDSVESDEIILDEVLVSAVRVTREAPVTFSNLKKARIEKRNLGQDIPILMNYLPSVVTTSDAGAGIGYTGIRVRGSDAQIMIARCIPPRLQIAPVQLDHVAPHGPDGQMG